MSTVAIVHTTPATIDSLRGILSTLAPDLVVRNYLDESLLPQINAQGQISEDVKYRFFSLVQGAALAGPDAMLCACSSVGELVEAANGVLAAPFLRIDAPMATQVATLGGRAVVCATLPSTLGPTRRLIEREAARLGSSLTLTDLLIDGAGALLTAGDVAGYDALLQEKFLSLADDADVFVLAQASMARAVPGLPQALQKRFLTSPQSGLEALVERVRRQA